jgi:hypothetical protein
MAENLDEYFRMVADMMAPIEGTEPETSAVGVEEREGLWPSAPGADRER